MQAIDTAVSGQVVCICQFDIARKKNLMLSHFMQRLLRDSQTARINKEFKEAKRKALNTLTFLTWVELSISPFFLYGDATCLMNMPFIFPLNPTLAEKHVNLPQQINTESAVTCLQSQPAPNTSSLSSEPIKNALAPGYCS